MKTKFLLLVTLALFSMGSACSDGNIRPLDELGRDTSGGIYYAKVGDILQVQVWGEPRVSGEVAIRDDGRFTLPLVDDIEAEGKTLMQIRDELSIRLQEFIPSAQVTVTVLQTAPTRYFIAGQFLKPGEYRSENKITLLQAIATAGGFAPFADESEVTLIRKGVTGELRYLLDYNQVVQGKEPNPELKDGDFISVK